MTSSPETLRATHEESREQAEIFFVDSTLRDGEQQDKKYAFMPITDRIEVFDNIVNAGIRRVEIGHLGNKHDIAFTKALIEHIHDRSALGDVRYDEIELQVLFGSIKELIEEGVKALDGFDKERVIVHVYDRLSPHLRNLATESYGIKQSADRVVEAAKTAYGHGFRKFSVSGEGSVCEDVSHQDAQDYYSRIGKGIQSFSDNVEQEVSINFNFANTFGQYTNHWGYRGLKSFNDRIKAAVPNATTSIHMHKDANGLAETYSQMAIHAGFDGIEGTMNGMGERAGNVALVDILTNYVMQAATDVRSIKISDEDENDMYTDVFHDRRLQQSIIDNLENWFKSCKRIDEIYLTETYGRKAKRIAKKIVNRISNLLIHKEVFYRDLQKLESSFGQTSLGRASAYAAGSGPHAHANREALKDPVNKPLWKSYGTFALYHALLGRPEAREVLSVNEERIRNITLATHAAGGSTKDVLNNNLIPASDEKKQASQEEAHHIHQLIRQRLAGAALTQG